MKETYDINYKSKLEKLREYLKEDLTGNSKNCIEILQDNIESARLKLSGLENDQKEDLGEVLIRTFSKDLSRYCDSFERYQKTLSEMETENLRYLRRKIVLGNPRFFEESWKEDSNEFFRTKKFIYSNIKDLSLVSKIDSTINCMITGLRRYTINKYGGD